MMEMNKIVQDLKMELEAVMKTQTEEALEMESLGKRTETTDSDISNRIPAMGERISGRGQKELIHQSSKILNLNNTLRLELIFK